MQRFLRPPSALLVLMQGWNQNGEWYLLGVEEELMLVDSRGQLAHRADEVVQSAQSAHVQHELMQCMVEVTTPPVSAQHVADAIRSMRQTARHLARAAGCDIASLAAHPTASACDQPITNQPRYLQLVEQLPTLGTLLVCGLHVHVCIPDAALALKVQQVLSALAPDLLALSANSPFSEGSDTGMTSVRAHHLLNLPRTGASPRWDSWSEYQLTIEEMVSNGEIKDETFVWHDVRLQPRYGTVEVRIFDSQYDWRQSAALACLVRKLAQMTVEGELEKEYDPIASAARRKQAITGELSLQPELLKAIRTLPAAHRDVLLDLMQTPGHAGQRQLGIERVVDTMSQQTHV